MVQLRTNSSPPPPVAAATNPNELLAKRKRGRPRKDEASQVNQKPEEDLVGRMVTGVIEGSVDAGYLLNVKVQDSDKKLRGLVFIPGKVSTVTPENDLAPNAKMYVAEQLKNTTTDHQQSLLNNDQPMKDAEIAESSRALVPHENNGKAVEAKEAMVEKNGVLQEETTRLVEFFPTPETTTAMMTDKPQPNLALSQKETEQPGMEAEKVVGPGEKVPEMLQLELGNKAIVSVDNNTNKNNTVTTERNPEASEKTNEEATVSKSGFIANLFEGGDKKEDCNMEEGKEATT